MSYQCYRISLVHFPRLEYLLTKWFDPFCHPCSILLKLWILRKFPMVLCLFRLLAFFNLWAIMLLFALNPHKTMRCNFSVILFNRMHPNRHWSCDMYQLIHPQNCIWFKRLRSVWLLSQCTRENRKFHSQAHGSRDGMYCSSPRALWQQTLNDRS